MRLELRSETSWPARSDNDESVDELASRWVSISIYPKPCLRARICGDLVRFCIYGEQIMDEDLPKRVSLAFHRYGYSPISLSRLLLRWWYLTLQSARISLHLAKRATYLLRLAVLLID